MLSKIESIRSSFHLHVKLLIMAALLTTCLPMPAQQVSVLPNALQMTPNPYSENVVQVIAPGSNPACIAGRVVITTGQNPDGIPITRSLYTRDGSFDKNAPSVPSTFRLTKNDRSGVDHVLVKTKDGSLLEFRLGGTTRDVTRRPAWWNDPVIGKPGNRVPVFVFRSIDCGQNWMLLSMIDPINVEGGKYAVPQAGGPGGWDRVEAYADPWTGYIYTSFSASGGKLTSNIKTSFVFRSTDGGKNWSEILNLYMWTPIVMTSTPNGRFYVYAANGHDPTLYYTLLQSQPSVQFSPGRQVHYVLNGDPIPADYDSMYLELVRKATNSISRISNDSTTSKVRLSYSWIDNRGKTAVAIIEAEVDNDADAPKVAPVNIFRAAQIDNSILSSTFIDPDADGANAGVDTSVFYWVEGTTDPSKQAVARYSVFRGEQAGTKPADLANPWMPSGSPADYFYGGSFLWNDKMNYFTQWPQPDGLWANIVTIPQPQLAHAPYQQEKPPRPSPCVGYRGRIKKEDPCRSEKPPSTPK